VTANALRFATTVLAALLLVPSVTPRASASDGPPITDGLVLLGTIMPKVTLLPVTNGSGTPSNFPPGPDVVTGLDASGNVVFRKTFRDQLYDFYVFVPLERSQIERLQRLELRVAGRSLERVATQHGAPEARAQSTGYERVRIRWNARAFPRLACSDEAGGSPAPLMLGGDFTGVDIRGTTLHCDFSDGVKTVYSDVRIPIERSGTKD
jgi:hypothetical protein